MYKAFSRNVLEDESEFFVGALPPELIPSPATFKALWRLHPKSFHVIKMHGRLVSTPRWQQAYGVDYAYTGQVNRALPVPRIIRPFLKYAQNDIDPRLNGVLLNWYDGLRGHYIGPHRDSTSNMIDGAPIVTLSLGEERIFRLTRYRGRQVHDFRTTPGTVFIMPFATNRAWKHAVPRSKEFSGRRISVTLRAFHA